MNVGAPQPSAALPATIAIDGPAARGKSTIGHALAQRLGYLYFDTGVVYRAVTWLALTRGVPISDEVAVAQLALTVPIDVVAPADACDGRLATVLAGGEDVTWAVRQPQVDANVSVVSAYPRVRDALKMHQRRIGHAGRVVMVGRDIGTVIMPDADLKIYLDASPAERARRRCEEGRERGLPVSYEEILAAMRRRDAFDSGRRTAPLRAAPDAQVVDSTDLSAPEVLQQIMGLIVAWQEARD
ncbi:MAG: (d)CMP kinase [Anaerolineae bacterium]|uniref:(d)CMP kinase n=1 Tax=Candidatus Amarolinea dominans TaxID=3140696 RepID=UPI0031355A6E|nr:(d)CMP kinase [Anaerolineae bacterium]